MASNAFKPDELVNMKGKEYPVVGGRLRLAHEESVDGIETELIQHDERKVIVRAIVTLPPAKGEAQRRFTGHGEADVARDARLKDAILELAETRAIARALRMAGFGVEHTGAEEIPKEGDADPKGQQTHGPKPVVKISPAAKAPSPPAQPAPQPASIEHPSQQAPAPRASSQPAPGALPQAACVGCGAPLPSRLVQREIAAGKKAGTILCHSCALKPSKVPTLGG